ncbi:MAG: histidinol-phosphate transaminase [Chloroflexi bacterium]|nr:histidinol-phosphate transaminase [Chloroflexota bacterium]
MKKDVLKLARPHFLTLAAYVPPIPEEKGNKRIIKLDQNECAYGCPPCVAEALTDFKEYHIYSDALQTKLREAIGKYCGAPKENIIASNGSNQLIDLICRVFVEKGDHVINCPPTFELFKTSTLLSEGTLVEVPRFDDFALDVDGVLQAVTPKTKLIFLATPNNPTGNSTPSKDIVRLLDSGVIVVVDEAYIEFGGQGMLPYLKDYPNMIIMRTFSKWAGLAGLRAGYAIAHPDIINLFMAVRLPYVMSIATQVAVMAVLQNLQTAEEFLNNTLAERERVALMLKQVPMFSRVLPSETNFFLCQVKDGKAALVDRKLKERGIIIRYYGKDPVLKDYLRITLGTPEENDIVVSALKEISIEV